MFLFFGFFFSFFLLGNFDFRLGCCIVPAAVPGQTDAGFVRIQRLMCPEWRELQGLGEAARPYEAVEAVVGQYFCISRLLEHVRRV